MAFVFVYLHSLSWFFFGNNKVSNVEESWALHLAISPLQTSQACIPTTPSARGWLLWPRAPPSYSPLTSLSWSSTATVRTTTSRSTMAWRGTKETSWGRFVGTSRLRSSPPPGTSCPSSSTQTATWPSEASTSATEKVIFFIHSKIHESGVL